MEKSSNDSGLIGYALCPNYAVYKNEGDICYISAHKLAELYGVDYDKCIVIDFTDEMTYLGRDLSKYIMLKPKSNSNYPLPST